MRKNVLGILLCLFVHLTFAIERFPDGTPVSDWFYQTTLPCIDSLGRKFVITDYGVEHDSTIVQTEAIQKVIDKAAETGGVVVIPKGVYLSGSLFFHSRTHLYLEEGAVLKGSDDISDFSLVDTRIEGQNRKYFAALVNAVNADGFTLSGKGTIDGNGLRYWKSFWLRRKYNPQCTNLEEMRPRLVFVSNSNHVSLSGVRLINSPFWTTHIYKSNNVKLLNLYIFAPEKPVRAPSSDAIDIDACKNVLVKNCFMSVNDDAIALKGGKGPWADKDPGNGGNSCIIIEDCIYDYCHGALTCGSESIHNRNIILRRCTLNRADRLLWLKMRPDTPQLYEYIVIEDIKGYAVNFLYVKPWTQFFDLKDRKDIPLSYAKYITMRNIELKCAHFLNVQKSDQYELSDFTFENLVIDSNNTSYDKGIIERFYTKDIVLK